MFLSIIRKVKKKTLVLLSSSLLFVFCGQVKTIEIRLNLDFAIRNLIFRFASRTKPMQDCNLNDPPPYSYRFDWYLNLVSDFCSI